MTDLAARLSAAIDERERAAKRAAERQGACWFDEEGFVSSATMPIGSPGQEYALRRYAPEDRWLLWDNEGSISLGVTPGVSAHMAANDPVAVLALCSAARRAANRHTSAPRSWESRFQQSCAWCVAGAPCVELENWAAAFDVPVEV